MGVLLGPGACPLRKWSRLCVCARVCIHGQCQISKLWLGSSWAGPLSAPRVWQVCWSHLRCDWRGSCIYPGLAMVLCNCSSGQPHKLAPGAAHLAPLRGRWSAQLWSLQHSWPDPVCGVCPEQSSPANVWQGDTGSESSGVMEGLPRPR